MPAHAAEAPVIRGAQSDYDGDRGTLLVSVESPVDISTVRAEIVTWDGVPVSTADRFVLHTGTARDGVWASARPLILDNLGYYRVHVEVTDAEGRTARRENAGNLDYSVVTSFRSVKLNHSWVDYERRQVTVSGRLMGRWPGTGTVRPLGGFPVQVNADLDWDDRGTAADGTFTGTVTINRTDERVYAHYVYDNDHLFFGSSRSAETRIDIRPRRTRLTVTVKPNHVNASEPVDITGTVTWKTPDGWRPIPPSNVGVLFCNAQYCPTSVGYPTTDENGRYGLTAVPWETGYYQVGYSAIDPQKFGLDPFVATAIGKAEIAVLQPASFSDISAVRHDSGAVAVTGHLRFENFTPGNIPVEIQYSSGPTGPWRTVATAEAQWDGRGNGFAATISGGRSGYWRAHYAGVLRAFQSATSETSFVP
jgi:hypothetical protein